MLFDKGLPYKSTSLRGKKAVSGKDSLAFSCPAYRSSTVATDSFKAQGIAARNCWSFFVIYSR